jgi:hypothetical protein
MYELWKALIELAHGTNNDKAFMKAVAEYMYQYKRLDYNQQGEISHLINENRA